MAAIETGLVLLCVFFFFSLIWELPPFIFREILKKKCGYDCSKCKNWMCDLKDCERKREKLESKSKEQ